MSIAGSSGCRLFFDEKLYGSGNFLSLIYVAKNLQLNYMQKYFYIIVFFLKSAEKTAVCSMSVFVTNSMRQKM